MKFLDYIGCLYIIAVVSAAAAAQHRFLGPARTGLWLLCCYSSAGLIAFSLDVFAIFVNCWLLCCYVKFPSYRVLVVVVLGLDFLGVLLHCLAVNCAAHVLSFRPPFGWLLFLFSMWRVAALVSFFNRPPFRWLLLSFFIIHIAHMSPPHRCFIHPLLLGCCFDSTSGCRPLPSSFVFHLRKGRCIAVGSFYFCPPLWLVVNSWVNEMMRMKTQIWITAHHRRLESNTIVDLPVGNV